MKLEIIVKYPIERQHPTPLLFIHGMLHAAWCWDVHFLDYFAQHGYAAWAVNLRGHGNSAGRENLRWTRIADYVEDVANAVQQLPSPPVLIGHSMGGFVIQKYLEDYGVPAAVLLSSPPPNGFWRAILRIARRRPLVFAQTNFTFIYVCIPMKELCAKLLGILDKAAGIARSLQPGQAELTAQMPIYNRPMRGAS